MNKNEISNGAILTPGQILKVTTEKLDSGLTGVDHIGATQCEFIEVSERSKWGVTLRVNVMGGRGPLLLNERFFEISPIEISVNK